MLIILEQINDGWMDMYVGYLSLTGKDWLSLGRSLEFWPVNAFDHEVHAMSMVVIHIVLETSGAMRFVEVKTHDLRIGVLIL